MNVVGPILVVSLAFVALCLGILLLVVAMEWWRESRK